MTVGNGYCRYCGARRAPPLLLDGLSILECARVSQMKEGTFPKTIFNFLEEGGSFYLYKDLGW